MKIWRQYAIWRAKNLRRVLAQLRQYYFIQVAVGLILGVILTLLTQINWLFIAVAIFGCWKAKLYVLIFSLMLTIAWLNILYLPGLQMAQQRLVGTSLQTRALVLDSWTQPSGDTLYIASTPDLPGLQLVKSFEQNGLSPGDSFIAQFTIQGLPSTLSYLDAEGFRFYLLGSQVHEVRADMSLAGILARAKSVLIKQIQVNISEPEGSLLVGLLLGGRAADLPQWLSQDLKLSGLSHIASISGYNVNVVVAALIGFAGLIPRKRLCWLLIPILLCFLVFVGVNNLPAQRAVFMGVLSLLAIAIGRPVSIWLVLILGLAVMLWLNPLAVNSVSLWLSLLAYIGVNCFTRFWLHLLPGFHSLVRETLAATLGVYVASVPIFISVFGSVSLAGLATNIVVLPLVPPAMGIGMLATTASFVLKPVGAFLFWCCKLVLDVIIQVSHFGAGITTLQITNPGVGWTCWVMMLGIILVADFKIFANERVAKA